MDLTIQSLIQPFIDFLKFEKRYSPHTVRSYNDDLVQFFGYIQTEFGETHYKDTQPAYIRSWLASLKEADLTARTVNRKLSALKSFFKYQVRTGEMEQTPLANVISPKASKRLPSFVAEPDLATLLASMNHTEDWKGLNAKMLLSLFYATGMRLSELINLKERQIDSSKRAIKILGKGNKERIVPVSAYVMELMEDYKAAKRKEFEKPAEFLLVTEKGKKLYPKYAYLLVRQYLSTIKTLEKKSPHTLRHTFATHLTNHGASLNAVKELLGHASLASTQIYTHNSIEKLKEVYKKAHPREQE